MTTVVGALLRVRVHAGRQFQLYTSKALRCAEGDARRYLEPSIAPSGVNDEADGLLAAFPDEEHPTTSFG